MKFVLIFSCSLIFLSCNYSDEEMIGVYIPHEYKNTYDTIQLAKNNVYKRKLYDVNGKMVLNMEGRWGVNKDVIEFKAPYFLNLDRDLSVFPELLKDTAGNGIGYIGRKNGVIQFCVGHFSGDLPNQNCYVKLHDK